MPLFQYFHARLDSVGELLLAVVADKIFSDLEVVAGEANELGLGAVILHVLQVLDFALVKLSVIASEHTCYLFDSAKLDVFLDLIVAEVQFAVVMVAADLQLF